MTAPGHRALTTHIFVAGSPYIESDAVFAVKKSLIKEFTQVDDPEQAAKYGLTGPFCLANFDIILLQAPATRREIRYRWPAAWALHDRGQFRSLSGPDCP